MRPYNKDTLYYILVINNHIIYYLDKLINICERKDIYFIYFPPYLLNINLIKESFI